MKSVICIALLYLFTSLTANAGEFHKPVKCSATESRVFVSYLLSGKSQEEGDNGSGFSFICMPTDTLDTETGMIDLLKRLQPSLKHQNITIIFVKTLTNKTFEPINSSAKP